MLRIRINHILQKYRLLPVQIKASFWIMICTFLQKGISMITTPIFTRLLSTSEYGQYNVFNSWYGIVTIIVTLNLFSGVHQQGIVKFDKDNLKFTSSLLGLTTLLTIIWVAVYFLFHDIWIRLFSLSSYQMISMFVLILTSATFNFWVNDQRLHYKYKAVVIVTVIVSLMKPILGIILVQYSADKVTARINGILVVELLVYTGLYFMILKKGRSLVSLKYWKYAILFNLPLVPHYLSQTILNHADRIMIQNIISDDAAGIYSLAYSVSSIMLLFNLALSQTLTPWFYQKIKNGQISDIKPIGYSTILIVMVVNLVLIILGPEVISIFAPASYYEAIWIIPPVAMGSVFLYGFELFSKFEFYYEKTLFTMIISIIGAGLNIILNQVFINRYGYLAAGYTTLFCYVIFAAGHYIYMFLICRKRADMCPYDAMTLGIFYSIFMMLGFLFMLAYKNIIIRYTIVSIILVVLIIYRNRIISFCKKLLSIRNHQVMR